MGVHSASQGKLQFPFLIQ